MIKSKHLILRLLKLSDAQAIYEQINDSDIVRWTLRIPHPYSLKIGKEFTKEAQKKRRNKEAYVFGIVPKEGGKVVGCIGLESIDWKNKNAELGYWLGKAYWGKGIMGEAVGLILRLGFEEVKLHRVYASLFVENVASRRVLEKAGFIFEGAMREQRFRFGKWHNVLTYGILEQEYKVKKFSQ